MADKKITAMTALTTPASTDVLPIVDVSEASDADKNKKITVGELFKGVPDGTATAPAIAFESDDGNGIFLSTTDTIGIATNGSSRMTVSTSAVSSTLPVSATAFSPTDSTVPTNGIYLPGADQVAISTSSSERIRIGANGEIGLAGANYGTSGQILTSAGSGAAPTWETPAAGGAGDKIEEGNTSAEVVDTGSDGHFKVVTEGAEALRIDSSQRVGIGTSTPNAKLEIQEGTTSGADLIKVSNSIDTAELIIDTGSNVANLKPGTGDAVALWGPSAEKMRVDANGVKVTEGQPISWHDGSGNNSAQIFGDSSDNLILSNTSSNTERFRVGPAGQLGIGGATYGTSGQVLTSNGPSAAASWEDASGGGDISSAAPERTFTNTTEEDTDGGRESKITFKGEQSGGEVSTLAQIEISHDGTNDDEKGKIIFKTNDGSDGSSPTTRLTINSSGYNLLKGFNRRPPLHRGPIFSKTAAATISVAANSTLNGFFYSSATAVTMPTHTDNTDYAIWQHPTDGSLVADASFTSAPAGATGGSVVGGYHYIPSGRPTAVNNGSPTAAAEILEYSIWDLTWRPSCPDPRGMACIDERFWCDLYFCGATSYAGTDFSAVPSSKIGLTIADASNHPLIPAFYGGDGSTTYADDGSLLAGCWYDFCEVASSFGKRLLTMSEFQVAAFGAPEAGSRGSDPGTVTWERASKWGLAQATGTLYSWGADLLFRDVDSQTFGFRTGVTRGRGSVYQQGSADSLAAVLLGGRWDLGTVSGSRASHWNDRPFLADDTVSARFAAEHLVTC